MQTAPEADSRLSIKASPKGTRAGFAVLGDGAGGTVTITVLPKPWAQNRAGRYLADGHDAGGSSHITMYEKEVVEIPAAKAVVASLSEAVLELNTPDSQGDLLELTRSTGAGTPLPGHADDDFEALISVMLLAKRQRTAFDGGGFQGVPAISLLRIVTQHLFVAEVSRLIDRVRPMYRERVEGLSGPRGRLSGRSLALALLTGKPEVESRFDELSTDTPILRIVLAALRVVATEQVPAIYTPTVAPTMDRAAALARRLDTVTLLDSERALLASGRLVLSPLDRPWKSAIDLAVQVLARNAVLPRTGQSSTPKAAAISVYMERWWEQCLAEALLVVAESGSIRKQHPAASPWGVGVASGNTDLIFRVGGKSVLADAKYKLDRASLGADDGYQMFAYSHTARHPLGDGLTEMGAIFYPTRVSSRDKSRSIDHSALVRVTDPHYKLLLLYLPFPSPGDVASDAAWRAYMDALAAGMCRALSESAAIAER